MKVVYFKPLPYRCRSKTAQKTIVEVLANATHFGLEKVNLKDSNKVQIKKKIEEAVDSGADGLVKALRRTKRKRRNRIKSSERDMGGNIRKHKNL